MPTMQRYPGKADWGSYMSNAPLIARKAIDEFGALQDEWELATVLELVRLHQVTTIVEIGSYTGGSLWAWRQIVPHVYGVTLEYHPHMFHSHGASMVYGDSTTQDTRTRLVRALDGRVVDMVFIDGGHDYPTASEDFRWANTLVEKGLIGLHDINLHLRYPSDDFIGPRRIWDENKDLFPTYEISNKDMEDPGVGIFVVQ